MSSKKLTILITRPTDSAQKFSEELEALGYHVIHSPLLEIVEKDFSFSENVRFDGCMFTSVHAVRVYVSKIKIVQNIPVFCIGPETRKTALSCGFENVMNADGDIDYLISMMADHVDIGGRIIHPRGELQAHDYKRIIEDAGYKYQDVIVYKTEKMSELSAETVERFLNQEIDAVTLFSKRTAETFLSIVQESSLALKNKVRKTKILCISPSVLECVRTLSYEVYVSQTTDRNGMVNLVTSHVSL